MVPMDLRRRLTVILAWAGLLCFATGLAATPRACGSDPEEALARSIPDAGVADAEAEAPVPKKEFPLATPSVGGYTLVDAFPGVLFDIPAAITWPKTAGAAPFVLERTGQIRTITNGQRRTLLDFGNKVHVAGEGGAVAIALHPQFGNGTSVNQYVYVWYNACNGANCSQPHTQRLERYTWNGATSTFLLASAFTMLEQKEYDVAHNAGKLLFGADGFLYFGNGDDDQTNNHQTIRNGLFAGIFRIDVDMDPTKSHAPPAHTPVPPGPGTPNTIFNRQGYFIPNDNPFIGAVPNALEEFWALGLRNPFSFSFDRQNGQMWAGDVGQAFREEINQIVKGGNYQWPLKEGELNDLETSLTTYTVGVQTAPKYTYGHSALADLVAVVGGFVYRGPSMPELNGKYVYTDWLTSRVWALDLTQTPPMRTTLIDHQYKMHPMGMGEDNDGEVYLVQYGPDLSDPLYSYGRIKKIVRDSSADAIPKRLKETTLFDDVPTAKPAANLIPYDVSSPLWSDASVKQRWIRLPAGQKVTLEPDGTFSYPVGTVFVKQFDLPSSMVVLGRTRHLETRVMVVGSETTYGYTFRWNAAGTDAELVREGTDETITDTVTNKSQVWHYPSFGECWECHRNGYADPDNTLRNDKYRILGFTPAQLGVTMLDDGVPKDQRIVLAAKGAFDAAIVPSMGPGLPRPSDTTKTLEERAYSYLAANCSSCHHENATYTGGGETWLANYGAGNLAERHLNDFAKNYSMTLRIGIPNGRLVVPKTPNTSILLARIKSNDPDLRMPPLAQNVVDTDGAALIEAWINSL